MRTGHKLVALLLISSCASLSHTPPLAPPPTITDPIHNFTTLIQQQICLEGSGSGRLKTPTQSGSFDFENQLNPAEQRWLWFFTLPLKGEESVELHWDSSGAVYSPQLPADPHLKTLLQQLIALLQFPPARCQLISAHRYVCTLSAKASTDVNWISLNQVEIHQKINDQQKSSDLLLKVIRSDHKAPIFSQYELQFTRSSYSTILQLQMDECRR